jgi:hypothetical protein
MKQTSMKQMVQVFILAGFVTAAVFALILSYGLYLPTITEVPVHKEDIWAAHQFYLIARNGFWISGACGVVLGFALPALFKLSRKINAKHDA